MKKFFLVILAVLMLSLSALPILPDRLVFSNADDGVPEYTTNKTESTRYSKGVWINSLNRWYEFGGYNSTGVSTPAYYSPATDTWTALTLPGETFAYIGAIIERDASTTSSIILSSTSVSNAYVRRYNVGTDTYESYTNLPSGNYYYTAPGFFTSSDAKIHILGKSETLDRDDVDVHYTHDIVTLTGAWTNVGSTNVTWDYPGRMYQYKYVSNGGLHYWFNGNYDNDGGTLLSNRYDESTSMFSNITDNRTNLGSNNRLLLSYVTNGIIYGVFSATNTVMDGSIVGVYDTATGLWSIYDSSINFGTNTRPNETDAVGWQGFFYDGEIYMMGQLSTSTYSNKRSIIYGAAGSTPTVTTSGYLFSTVGGQVIHTFLGSVSSDNTVSRRGFNIGLASGIWLQKLNLQQTYGTINGNTGWVNEDGTITPLTDNSTDGDFALSSQLLSENTTYYYQAYASRYQAGLWTTGYGTIRSLTTAAGLAFGVPVVTTDGAQVVPPPAFDNALQVSGTVVMSNLPIIERGFFYSLSTNMTNPNSISQIDNNLALGYYVMSRNMSGMFAMPGTVIYVQAFAKNSANVIGYGQVLSCTVPSINVLPGSLVLEITNIAVTGTEALISVSITNPESVVIQRYGLVWGVTSLFGETWNTPATSSLTSYNHLITGLSETAVYYTKASVMVNNKWYFSLVKMFTTGATIPFVTFGLPTVTTKVATGVGATYFTANGEIISKGDSDVTERGFSYNLNNVGKLSDWDKITVSGNFTVGNFSRVITLTDTNITVYYSALATNSYGTSYGSVYYVRLGTGGGSTNVTTPGGGVGTTGLGDFAQWLKDLMASWGMDNVMGHWAFMGLIILLLAVVFVGSAFAVKDETARKVLFVILGLLVFAVFGAFIFSGLLGIWAVAILVIVAVGLIIIVVGKLLNRGEV